MGHTGYGVATYNIFLSLEDRGWDIALFNKSKDLSQRSSAIEFPLLQKASAKSKLFHRDADCLKIWHQFDLAERVGKGKYYALPFFEINNFNEEERHHLAYPDELIVSSKWAKQVLEDNCIRANSDDITVIPCGVDLNIFNPVQAQEIRDSSKTDNYIFLNCGKWEIRKGHDFLVEVFNETFTPDDKVELWLMPHNPFLSSSEQFRWEEFYLNTPMGKAGKITIVPWQETHDHVAVVMSQADCGVFPSRAEGWNLELLEMMAMGKRVIATDYSAHTEFCTTDNCDLIEINELESASDGRWFHGTGEWAKFGLRQMTQLQDYMREAVKFGAYTNEAGIATGKELTWDHTGKMIEELLLKD